MPAPTEAVVRPRQNMIAVNLEPVHNALYSLLLIVRADQLSGLGEWVINARDRLTPTELANHRLVLEGLYYALIPRSTWPSFEAYLDRLETMDPVTLRDRLIDAYFEMPCKREEPSPFQSIEQVLISADNYVNFLTGRFGEKYIDPELERQAYTYIVRPGAMQALIVTHLRMMWERFLATEWLRVQPMLNDAVTAFGAIDLNAMSVKEVVQFVTGQQLSDLSSPALEEEFWRITFVPSAHVGPYLGEFYHGDEYIILFGARLPEGSRVVAPDLSRHEIVMRLNSLADDTRLRILRFIAEHGEQPSQAIMSGLDLSQSTASRHLTQLCATGFLNGRRCEGAKCYSLCEDRLRDTMQAVLAFLAVSA